MKKIITTLSIIFILINNSYSETNTTTSEIKCISFIKKYSYFEKNIPKEIEFFNLIDDSEKQEKNKQAFLIFNLFSDISFNFFTIKNNCTLLNKEDIFFIEEDIKNKKILAKNIFEFIINNR